MQTVVSTADLPPLTGRRGVIPGRFLLEGGRFGLDRLTLVLGQTASGKGVCLHRPAYEELFIVHGGRGACTPSVRRSWRPDPAMASSSRPAVPHRFVNHAGETLSHTAVQLEQVRVRRRIP